MQTGTRLDSHWPTPHPVSRNTAPKIECPIALNGTVGLRTSAFCQSRSLQCMSMADLWKGDSLLWGNANVLYRVTSALFTL